MQEKSEYNTLIKITTCKENLKYCLNQWKIIPREFIIGKVKKNINEHAKILE